jgi:hypothetical protein
MCSYNPAQPGSAYFSVGNAISALGFALAIQQLLKPIYQFRLRAYGIQYSYLVIGIFFGFVAVIVAAILPNLPISRLYFFSYPVVWELIGGLTIACVYGFAAFVVLSPARLTRRNAISFCRAAANLLAQATNEDRIKFAADLTHNIVPLFKIASAWEAAERHAVHLEFERLREIGEPQVVRGRAKVSAFYLFTHQASLERASYACTLFRLLSDTKFCAALVSECPWDAAALISKIAENKLHIEDAEAFIQQIAHQAIADNESIVAREVSYRGFHSAPLLLKSLFGDPFILRCFRPLNSLQFERATANSYGFIERFSGAAELTLKTTVKHLGHWDTAHLYDLQFAYEKVSRYIGWSQEEDSGAGFTEVVWSDGITELYKIASKHIEAMNLADRRSLFDAGQKNPNSNFVAIVAEIVFDSLESISHAFGGDTNRFWSHAIGIMTDVFPFHDSEPVGMDPLQQQIATRLIKKLKENMEGWYPPISKVLLATIGPYNDGIQIKDRSAYVILKDAVYAELQKLPALYKSEPTKFANFLPAQVKYEFESNSLTHHYSDGASIATKLSELKLPDVDLYNASTWRA